METPWLRGLFLRHDSKVQFPTRKGLMREHIPTMLTRNMDKTLLHVLMSCVTISVTSDLWMSWCGFDTFYLVVHFVNDEWVSRHGMVGIFKVVDTSGVALAEVVKWVLREFRLTDEVLAYVKDEGANMNTLAISMRSIIERISLIKLNHDQVLV
jgi:hypothetical protein